MANNIILVALNHYHHHLCEEYSRLVSECRMRNGNTLGMESINRDIEKIREVCRLATTKLEITYSTFARGVTVAVRNENGDMLLGILRRPENDESLVTVYDKLRADVEEWCQQWYSHIPKTDIQYFYK